MNVGQDRYGLDGIQYNLQAICELNENNLPINFDLEYEKLFLKEAKKISRLNSSFSKLVEQAITYFNQLFPEHQVLHYIHFPLLDSIEKEYKLTLFKENLPDDALYLGANQVEIKECNIILPRTLYHLFFVYIVLKNGNDEEKYPLLKKWISMHEEIPILGEIDKTKYEQTANQIHLDISSFLNKKILSSPLKWKDVKILVYAICHELDVIYKNQHLVSDDRKENLWYHFYQFCFYGNEGPNKFKEMMYRAIALEWGAPCHTEILYRASQLSADDILKSETEAHSLSFSPSFLAGIVFEGTSSGTCSYSYYNNLQDKQLYALQLLPSKVEKYFFYPSLFNNYPLLPFLTSAI